jgi:protein-L-isoaspartate(D-aspartate) O-methyltransferase
MDRDTELEIVRRAYAKQIMASFGVSDRRIEAAFASVKREDFLGRGPWQIVRWGRGYLPTPSRDPVFVYDDVVVGILPERSLNNGQPSLHAALIASAAPKAGEHAVHVGAGVGYYTAIARSEAALPRVNAPFGHLTPSPPPRAWRGAARGRPPCSPYAARCGHGRR